MSEEMEFEHRYALAKEPDLKIRKSTVLLSACCFHPLAHSTAGNKQTFCPCGKPWEGIEVWFDETGDRMFKVISDARGHVPTVKRKKVNP